MNRKTFIKLAGLAPFLAGTSTLDRLYQSSKEWEKTEKMPVLFLGHGSPMNAIEENIFVQGFRSAARDIPDPKAILCISAHWYTRGTKVTAMEMPRTIHDFGGFPEELFQVQYPAPGSPQLAKETKSLMPQIEVELDHQWGLDHGAWSVIKHMYPNADVPVIQLSIDYTKPPLYHYELAQCLTELRSKGVLIIGSGNIVHNLRRVDFSKINEDYGYDWALEARADVNQLMLDGNFAPLFDYDKRSRALQLSVPTPDHYLPLLYVLGLKDNKEPINLFNDRMVAGSISMTSVQIG